MIKQNYIISYLVYDNKNCIIKQGKARLKNKYSELEAKIATETNLRKLHPSMNRLVITSCAVESPFGDIFGDIFKF